MAEDPRRSVPLREVATALGGGGHALALLVLVLPETIPLPVPSISLVLGVPLILVAWHLVVHGDDGTLPGRVRDVEVPTAAAKVVDRWVGPVVRWIERLSQPHWPAIARRQRLAGVVCLYLAILLALPIPFVNLVPAVCLAAIALGLVRRDGVYVAAGLAGTVGLTVALIYLVAVVRDAMTTAG